LPPDPPSLLLSVQIILHLQKNCNNNYIYYNRNTCVWPIASWNRCGGAKFLPKLATLSRTLLIPNYSTHLQSRFLFYFYFIYLFLKKLTLGTTLIKTIK
jgi:hypothetical protein